MVSLGLEGFEYHMVLWSLGNITQRKSVVWNLAIIGMVSFQSCALCRFKSSLEHVKKGCKVVLTLFNPRRWFQTFFIFTPIWGRFPF